MVLEAYSRLISPTWFGKGCGEAQEDQLAVQ